MAGTADDNTIPAGEWRPLLSELLDFVSKCLRSEDAAKEFLLDYLATHRIDWRYRCTTEAPRSTMPSEWRKPGVDPIPNASQEAGPVYSFFWRAREKGQFDVDWQASSVDYDGPLIKADFHSDNRGGRHATAFFDGFWRVKIRITLIRINAAPIIAELRSLGLPVAVALSEAGDHVQPAGPDKRAVELDEPNQWPWQKDPTLIAKEGSEPRRIQLACQQKKLDPAIQLLSKAKICKALEEAGVKDISESSVRRAFDREGDRID
jgi:hypothetical protein